MKRTVYPDLVLAVTLGARGFAYVLLESPQTPFDWATVTLVAKERTAAATDRITLLMNQYQPTVLVLEDLSAPGGRHSKGLQALSRQLAHLAGSRGIGVAVFDRQAIRTAFAPLGARTKPEIAKAIADAIPAFNHRLPPKRKVWMPEDRRQMLFDATALGITYYSGMS